MAPEIIKQVEKPFLPDRRTRSGEVRINRYKDKDCYYSQAVDIWAVGCMVYDLCVGSTPFDGFDEDGNLISEKQLCMNILKTEPSFKHPYFGWSGGASNPVAKPDSVQHFIEQCLIRDPE